MLTILLITTLGVFWAWESFVDIFPWGVPTWISPVAVFLIALALAWPEWRLAMAVAGGVGLLHVAVRGLPARTDAVNLSQIRSRLPRIP